MRAVVQRVTEASVTVAGEIVGAIGAGMVVLVGVEAGDGRAEAQALTAKLAGLRIFADEEGRMNRSLIETDGAALVVSQFTLLGNVRRGRRPSFTAAARPSAAEPLVAEVARRLEAEGVEVATGSFGAAMSLRLVNEGPVTIIVEARDGRVV